MIDQSSLENYDINWSDVGHESNIITNLFDNFFGWVNDNLEGKYSTLDEQRKIMLKDNPDLDIKALDDGFQLEAERLNAIRQRQSRGFTIIDINPGLASGNDYPVTIPYEFLFDGTNFIPADNDSITKNFRSIPIDIAGNFVKIEYIYENNSQANAFNGVNTRPIAKTKYASVFKNFNIINGLPYPNTADLTTNYTSYDFDNYARNKVFIGFNDTISKPHLVTRSGDAFNTYFNSLVIHFNIGCPKIRITIGFNSDKTDGPTDAPINAQLHLMGSGRLFKDFDSPLIPFNFNSGDELTPYDIRGTTYFAAVATQIASKFLVINPTQITGSGTDDLGYSVLFLTNIEFNASRNNAIDLSIGFNLRVGPAVGPTNPNNIRVFSTYLRLNNGAASENGSAKHTLQTPIRVVIPSGQLLYLDIYYFGSAPSLFNVTYAISGYSLGMLRKVTDNAGGFDIFTSKYITDATFLTDFNRVEAIKDN